ncbi:MAG TPA: hypothetical protein VF476_08675 [Chitinophagaceae bacterium]
MEQGWDPEVKKYFKKVLNSIVYGLIWMMTIAWLGAYKELAIINGRPGIGNILFYIFLLLSLGLLLRYYYRTWKK